VAVIGRVKKFLRSVRNGEFFPDVENDTGGSYNVTSKLFQGAGDDSAPLPDDLSVSVDTQKSGNLGAVGFIDPVNQGVSSPGEVRRYARSSDGVVVSQLYQQNDGKITLENDQGHIFISSDGQITSENEGVSFTLFPTGNGLIDNGVFTLAFDAAGNADLLNTAGFIKILANGQVNINGTIFNTNGSIVMASGSGIGMAGGGAIDMSSGGDVIFGSTTYRTHKHNDPIAGQTSTPV